MVPIAKPKLASCAPFRLPSAHYLSQSPPVNDRRLADQSPATPTHHSRSPFAALPPPDLPPANLPDLPETLVNLIASLCDAPPAARKALHLTCQPLRRSICATLTRITLPSHHLLDPSTTWVYPSVSQLRVTCTSDAPPPPVTPTLNLPPHLSRLVIRTSVTCPQQDTVSYIVRASTNLPSLSLTRSASLKNNIEADPPLSTITTHCAPTLLSLTISGLSISPHAAHRLAALTALTHLDVQDSHPCESLPALNALFSTLQYMTSLQSVAAEAKSAAHLACLATLPSLTALDLRPLTPSCKSGHSLSALASLTSLRSLTLRTFHTASLASLLPNALLSSLHLLNCDITDRNLAPLGSFPALASLVLDSCQYETLDTLTVSVGTFAGGLTSLKTSLHELRIWTVPRFPLPTQVITTLSSLTTLSVDRTDLPSAAAAPHPPPGALPPAPLLAHLVTFSDRTLAAGCRELAYLAQLPRLTSLEVAYICEGIRARSVDPITIPTPFPALRGIYIIEQSLVWRPDSIPPRWPIILGAAAPALSSLSVMLYGAPADNDLSCLVEHLGGLSTLTVKGEFDRGLWALTGLRALQELSVQTLKDHVQEVADVGVALSWQGLTRLGCQGHRGVAREMLARGKWGCSVVSAGKW